MVWKPKIRVHANGRISFPGAVEYRVATPAGVEILPYPPTAATHPAPPKPVPLSGPEIPRLIAEGKIRPLPCSLAYKIVELDLDEYRRLFQSGWTADPRHRGSAGGMTDNRIAPGG